MDSSVYEDSSHCCIGQSTSLLVIGSGVQSHGEVIKHHRYSSVLRSPNNHCVVHMVSLK